jgi:hypothetical protein
MANGEGMSIDGNGSVQWEVVTKEDDPRKAETLPFGSDRLGRKNRGADRTHGQYFKIELLLPADPAEKERFLGQFTGSPVKTPRGDVIVLYMPVEKFDHQIDVHWNDSIAPPVTRARSV